MMEILASLLVIENQYNSPFATSAAEQVLACVLG